jgi:DNA-binding NarL/FixJ family response regulator
VLAHILRITPECEDDRMSRTIVLVDDDEGFRRWARAWLVAQGYVILGEASAARPAIASVRQLRPEVVLVDVQLPDLDGFELTELLRNLPDPPAVILISSREWADYGDRVASSGAHGFVSKDELTREAIESLVRGSP